MPGSEAVRERIIKTTIALIEQYEGDTKRITARVIAEKAEVGLGLINYHFGSKDALITECVQRIISEVVTGFHMEKEFSSDQERLTAWAAHVFDFLFEHSAISRISILGDLQHYTDNCNSVCTQHGFMRSLKEDVSNQDRSLLAFILTSAMQTAFLGSEAVHQILGYDFSRPEGRRAYIERLVDILFEGTAKIDE